jgi:hypothetical protein
MRGGFFFAVAGVLSAQALPDPTDVLARARDKIVESHPRLPNYTCVQTVDRGYFRRAVQPSPFPPCSQMHAEEDAAHAFQIDPYLTDRLRLDVKVSAGVEIGSWAGASQFDAKSIFDLVGRGPFGTGTLGSFLSDIFDNGGTSFAYNGEVLSDSGKLYQYSYQVPLGASHYLVKAGRNWTAIAYEGEVSIDPHSLDLSHLVVRSYHLPVETEACEVVTRADYARVHIGAGDFLLPQRSRLHIVTVSTNEDDVVTTYSGCREYQSESTIRFEGDPAITAGNKTEAAHAARLPAGLPISLELIAPIDTDVAAAGDVVTEKVRKPVRVKGSKEVLIPAGAMVRGRILKMQHWMMPPNRFDIAIRLEAWEAGGVSAPLYAQPDRSETAPEAGMRKRGVPINLPPAGQLPTIRTYVFFTDAKRHVMPRGFESKWLTVNAPKEP